MRLSVTVLGGGDAGFSWPELELHGPDGEPLWSRRSTSQVRSAGEGQEATQEVTIRGDASWIDTVRMRFLAGRTYIEVPFRFKEVPLP